VQYIISRYAEKGEDAEFEASMGLFNHLGKICGLRHLEQELRVVISRNECELPGGKLLGAHITDAPVSYIPGTEGWLYVLEAVTKD